MLAETVVVREGERSRKVPKLRALMTALVNRGLKGDHRAAATLLATLLRLDGVAVPPRSRQHSLRPRTPRSWSGHCA